MNICSTSCIRQVAKLGVATHDLAYTRCQSRIPVKDAHQILTALLQAQRRKPNGISQPGAPRRSPAHASSRKHVNRNEARKRATDHPIRWDYGSFRHHLQANATLRKTLALRVYLSQIRAPASVSATRHVNHQLVNMRGSR